MATTSRKNYELKRQARDAMSNESDPIIKLRLACLSRGAGGIKALCDAFSVFDGDGSQFIDFQEFKRGLRMYGLHMELPEIRDTFEAFDENDDELIDMEEFLIALRPPMSNTRKDIVMKAFKKLDTVGDGYISFRDLKGNYDFTKHAKYRSGEWTEDDVFRDFLKRFDSHHGDGLISVEEFLTYYSGLSASVYNDAEFDLIIRNAYKL